jgi:hypothetical protein
MCTGGLYMKKNVGRVDAVMRITLGLTGVAWGTAKMMRRPDDSLPMLVTLASAMKVAEGITRFCPLTAMFTADYGRMMDRAKDQLPIDRFTDQLERRANQMQKMVRKTANNTVPDTVRAGADTVRSGVNAVQSTMNTTRDAVEGTVEDLFDDYEPQH